MIGRGRFSGSQGSHFCRNLLIAGVVGCVLLVYGVYSWLGSEPDPSTKNTVQGPGSGRQNRSQWKTQTFVGIPDAVLSKANDVKIEERKITLDVEGQTVTVFLREVGSTGSSISILLLHGASSSSEVWVKTKTLHLLGALGHRTIAVDLPGWAQSKGSKLKKNQSANFLKQFIKQEKLGRPVIVSPSMSGKYAIPFMMKPEPSSCRDRMLAYIPLAPVRTELYNEAEYRRCEIPVMIVYGTKDVSLGHTSAGHLRNMPNSEIFTMEGAGHANYEERPGEWNRLLYNFLLALQRKAG